KYYRYHRDHGHDTEECRHLKNQIEDLIRKGHLRRGVIHTISRGVTSGGNHSRSRKAYARQTFAVQQYTHSKRLELGGEEEAICFSEVDYEGVRLPYDDPVVVTLLVELFTMKRILIDSGSSPDILYKHAFDQLMIPTDLKPVKTPLVGFRGEMIHPLGSIDLSVVVGTAPCQNQVHMTFLVVDTPSPYNAIIGR
ncbi:LOW QUALITY PROTEIN: hypothetical protein CFOL_v3_15934, partial [Cephalotus follicularis]